MKSNKGIVVLALLSTWLGLAWDRARGQADEECSTASSIQSDEPAVPAACPRKGDCDQAGTRDTWDAQGTPMTVRVRLHVLDPEITELDEPERTNEISGQVDKIKDHYADWKIALDVSWHVVEQAQYGTVYTWGDVAYMKAAYAENPADQLNVYVTDIQIDEDDNDVPDFAGHGTFPWDANAAETPGGITIDGAAFASNRTTLTHEIGHCLGLWHSHHGATRGELDAHGAGCDPQTGDACACRCYGSGFCDGSCYDTDCNLVGDFCCDTPTTKANFDCDDPADGNPCYPNYWPDTAYYNFMGYAQDEGRRPAGASSRRSRQDGCTVGPAIRMKRCGGGSRTTWPAAWWTAPACSCRRVAAPTRTARPSNAARTPIVALASCAVPMCAATGTAATTRTAAARRLSV
jgi:hypothetical protein